MTRDLNTDYRHAMDSRDGTCPRTDLELLTLQAEMALDDRGRLAGTCGVMAAVAREGQRLYIGSDTPDTLVPALFDAVGTSPHLTAPDREPPVLSVCRAILEPDHGPLSLEAGPSYLIEPSVRCEIQAPIVRSDGTVSDRLRQLNPGNWEADEWEDLLDGILGPWAMAIVDGRVVSLCHTPGRMTELAAECGVWTHPDFRGRGYAAAVTASWADILRPSSRYLFYSTDSGNRSSQRVAARLQLRMIGWTWRLIRANVEQRSHRHPLSRTPS